MIELIAKVTYKNRMGDSSDTMADKRLYLGFDFSTQQVKAVVIDAALNVVCDERVTFDADLPEYRTVGGVNVKGRQVTAPTIMWVKALDMLMEKIRIAGVDFADVAGVSGCGQQHGSVYWRVGARDMLRKANPDKFLHDELAHAFSVLDSPVWMDSSTSAECRKLEEAVGGAQRLADVTGSRAYERFTGNQIAKIHRERAEAYANTERVSLVSSFAASLFVGDYAPIDLSDGGGMNLLDLEKKDWSDQCLDACAPDLRIKLSQPVPSSTIVGAISEYMIERYGFSPECKVVAFTGDNPASMAGLRMRPGEMGVTLGTSDCVFMWIPNKEQDEDASGGGPTPQTVGHVWPNPIETEDYMALLCYKNGSLSRERICNDAAEGSWEIFSQLLDSTPRGNFGNIGMYFDNPEITPPLLMGDFRFNKAGERVTRFASKEAEVRALVEGQFMAKRIHAEQMGFRVSKETRILVCGGASANDAILQVISDIFNAPVFTKETGPLCACLGGAYRAIHVLKAASGFGTVRMSFSDVVAESEGEAYESLGSGRSWRPQKDAASVYKPLMERYRALEQRILSRDDGSG